MAEWGTFATSGPLSPNSTGPTITSGVDKGGTSPVHETWAGPFGLITLITPCTLVITGVDRCCTSPERETWEGGEKTERASWGTSKSEGEAVEQGNSAGATSMLSPEAPLPPGEEVAVGRRGSHHVSDVPSRGTPTLVGGGRS